MAHPLRVGTQCRPQHTDYPTMRDAWLRAEEAGVDALFNGIDAPAFDLSLVKRLVQYRDAR